MAEVFEMYAAPSWWLFVAFFVGVYAPPVARFIVNLLKELRS